jgi:hypothetical protein
MGWPVRVIRLAENPQEDGLWCGSNGLSLAGRPLVQEDESGFRPRPFAELQTTLDEVYGPAPRLDAKDFLPGLSAVARSLNKGDLPLAMISSVMLKLPDIPAARINKYSDEEDRDAHGRWTQGGEGDLEEPSPVDTTPGEAPTAAPVEAEVAGEAEEGVIGRLAPRVLSLLGDFAEAASGPVTVATAVLIPTNSSNIHYIDLPGFPGLSCRSDEGIVTISYLDPATDRIQRLYEGAPDKDGFYHDADGYVIGQRVGASALFDEEALKDFAAKAGLASEPADEEPPSDPSPAGSDDDQRNCPVPTPENTKGRSRRSVAYQTQITGLPEGWDVVLNGVRFDGCDEETQRMKEAKGLGMEWMLNWPKEKLENSKFYQRMIRQAGRQNEASTGRGDDYYFASQKMADFFSTKFAEKGYSNIRVHHVEAIVKKIAEWLRHIFFKQHSRKTTPIHMTGR